MKLKIASLLAALSLAIQPLASADQYLKPDASPDGSTLITIEEPESYESVRKGLTLKPTGGYD